MASGFGQFLGGAAAGAGAGSFGGPIGAGIGAAIGGLGSLLFGGGSDPQPTAINYNDINLEKDNPELFARIQQNDNIIAQAKQLYDQRRTTLSPGETAAYNSYMGSVGNSLATSGLAGSPDGIAAGASLQRKYLDDQNDRLYQQQNSLFNNYQGAVNTGYNETRQGLSDVYNARAGNNQVTEANLGASNQFYSGLFNGGLSLAGSANNANAMKDMYAQRYGTPGQPPPQVPGQYVPSSNGGYSLGASGVPAQSYSPPGGSAFGMDYSFGGG